jgi:tRNA threonylcarbamoyladenosine biosynthesis protein TsaB
MQSSNPVILAIETSQRLGGIAVRDRAGQVHVEPLATDLRHDDDLLPAIERTYDRLGLAPGDTGVIGVSIGPGGFTGLRIGVATAKLLAHVLGSSLVAVPSALVVAEGHAGAGPIIVALAAKGETVCATRVIRTAGEWAPKDSGALVERLDLDEVEAVLADDHLPGPMRRRCAEAGIDVITPSFEPRHCLAVTTRWLACGRTVEPTELTPLYARSPAVTLRR